MIRRSTASAIQLSLGREELVDKHMSWGDAHLYQSVHDRSKRGIAPRVSPRVAVIASMALSLGLWWALWAVISSVASALLS